MESYVCGYACTSAIKSLYWAEAFLRSAVSQQAQAGTCPQNQAQGRQPRAWRAQAAVASWVGLYGSYAEAACKLPIITRLHCTAALNAQDNSGNSQKQAALHAHTSIAIYNLHPTCISLVHTQVICHICGLAVKSEMKHG